MEAYLTFYEVFLFDLSFQLVGKQELTDRKTKIIEEQTSKDEQLKTLMAEMDEINRIAQEERKQNAEKVIQN